MKIRLKFAKKAGASFLGHLDIMRFFQRLFNRSNVRMEYSKGFNPHQLMSFAQPLGVGVTSSADYMDAEIAPGQDLENICDQMNINCGTGFKIINIKELRDDARSAMAMLRYSDYDVDVSGLDMDQDIVKKIIEEVLASDKIEVLKKTKKKETTVDIRPCVKGLRYENGHLLMTVTAGSADNLKPDILTELIAIKAGADYAREKIRINRTEMYAGNMIPLDEYQINEKTG